MFIFIYGIIIIILEFGKNIWVGGIVFVFKFFMLKLEVVRMFIVIVVRINLLGS